MKVIALLCVVLLVSSCAYMPKAEPWTNGDKALLAASVLAVAADAYTTKRMLNNPDNYEVNPIMGKHPSDTKIYITLGAFHALVVAVAHYWKPVRKPILAVKTGINTGCAIHNKKNLDWSD